MPQKRTHSIKIYYPGKLALKNEQTPFHCIESTNMMTIEDIPESRKEISILLQKAVK